MVRIERLDPGEAADEVSVAFNTFSNIMRAEQWPEDPPMPLDEEMRRLRSIPAFVSHHTWVARDAGTILASAVATFMRVDENRHVLEFRITVLPAHRRRGIARRLLGEVLRLAQREERTLLTTWTVSTVPAGDAFLHRLGAEPGLVNRISQLDLRDLDRDLLRRWVAQAPERAAGFDLLTWTEGVPDEHLDEYVKVGQAMNQAPRGDIRVEDMHFTAEQVRQWHAADRGRGRERWTIVARERSTEAFAGFTEVVWHPNRPWLVEQHGTAVHPGYQNRGLGRWLKAAMLEKVLAERPAARFIRTGNAQINAPMLRINEALGFKPWQTSTVWQVERHQVEDYLTP